MSLVVLSSKDDRTTSDSSGFFIDVVLFLPRGGGDVLLDFVVCMVVRNDSTRVQATSPSSMRLSMMLMPYSSLMRLSLYQTMHSSNNVMNSSIETPWKLRLWKNSCLSLPKTTGGCVVRTAALRAHRPRQAVAPADTDPLCTSERCTYKLNSGQWQQQLQLNYAWVEECD